MSSYKTSTLETIEIVPRKHVPSDFPHLVDDFTLAFYLGISGKTLWYVAKCRDAMYHKFQKPKKSGGYRVLHNPNPLIRVVHKQIRRKILLPLCEKLGPHVTAYRIGKSTVDAARLHLADCPVCVTADGEHTCTFTDDGAGHLRKNSTNCLACAPVPVHDCPRRGIKIHMDLKDFFGSTRRAWIRHYFHKKLDMSHYAASLLAQVLTVELYAAEKNYTWQGVPQGGKASGDITNLIADWRLDQPMLKMLPKGIAYSRYADDLYFSIPEVLSFDDTNALLNRIRKVISDSGYEVNNKKTHVQRPHKQQRLLGVTLNQKINMGRDEYRLMKSVTHHCYVDGFEKVAAKNNMTTPGELCSWIEGKLAYYSVLSPQRARELKQRFELAKAKHGLNNEMLFNFKSTT